MLAVECGFPVLLQKLSEVLLVQNLSFTSFRQVTGVKTQASVQKLLANCCNNFRILF